MCGSLVAETLTGPCAWDDEWNWVSARAVGWLACAGLPVRLEFSLHVTTPAMNKRRVYDRVARLYDFLDLPFERRRYRPIRPELFAGTGGTVLDAGVGTGRNMPFYPAGARVTGIDLSPRMLERARRRRDELGLAVDLCEMDVRRTAFPDGHFDHVVATFLFCVLDPEDQAPALQELRRICKPGGDIRLLEYAYSDDPWRRFVMRLWAPWVRFAYGAAFDRDTERYVAAAGLEVEASRFLYADIVKLLVLRA
jgi:ubiquinone/menaquinone biosynthesis C-methylase UbiE